MPYKSPQERPGVTRITGGGNKNKTGRGDGLKGGNPLAGRPSATTDHYPQTKNAPGRNESGSMPGPYNTRGYSNVKVPSSQQVKDATVAPDGTRRVKKG